MDTLQKYDFTEQQAAFVSEYAQSANVSKAAAAAGISRGTAYSWLAKDEYIQAIAEVRSRAMSSAWTSLSAGLQDAVDAVRGVLTNDAAATNARLRAAEIIIDQAQLLLDKQEIIARLDKLEGLVGEK